MKTFLFLLLFSVLSVTLMAQTPVALKLNLEKGKTYTVKTISKQVMQQGVAGQSMTINILSNHVISFKMLGQENDVVELEVRFDTIVNKISTAMYTKESNSALPGKEPLERLQNKISLYPLNAKVSSSGKFIGFTNLDQFKEKVMLVIDSLPDTKKDEAKKQAEMMLKESVLKSSVEPLFSHLTEKQVAINDSWESSYVATQNDISFLVFLTYTLKAIEKGQAVVSGTSEMESMPSSNSTIKLEQPIKGSSVFDGRVDLTTGLMSTLSQKNKLEGNMTVSSGGTDYKVDLKIDAQSESSLIK
ncbi:MAG TPA: DUF6263 family protein [Bacteroidales bacterium]|nr:DUF6263 family protein [Bacteroidales bacterium]